MGSSLRFTRILSSVSWESPPASTAMQIASREARLRAFMLLPTPIALKPFHIPEVTSIIVHFVDAHIGSSSNVEMTVEVHGDSSKRLGTSSQFSFSATSPFTTLSAIVHAHCARAQPTALSKKQTNCFPPCWTIFMQKSVSSMSGVEVDAGVDTSRFAGGAGGAEAPGGGPGGR